MQVGFFVELLWQKNSSGGTRCTCSPNTATLSVILPNNKKLVFVIRSCACEEAQMDVTGTSSSDSSG